MKGRMVSFLLACAALGGGVWAGTGPVTGRGDGETPDFVLSRPEKGTWSFRAVANALGAAVVEVSVGLSSPVSAPPPKFSLSFAMPQRDVGHLWSSGGFCAPVPPKVVRAHDVFGTPVAAPAVGADVQSLACPEAGKVY